MAHKKSGGTTAGNRDSIGKRLGIKVFGGQKIKPGQIIVRQKGSKFFPGNGVGRGRDFTLFATKSGIVKFGQRLGKKIVAVV